MVNPHVSRCVAACCERPASGLASGSDAGADAGAAAVRRRAICRAAACVSATARPTAGGRGTRRATGPGAVEDQRGDHVLWMLGTLDHVPRQMTWHSRQVESGAWLCQALLPGYPSLSAHLGPIMMVRLYVQWRGMQRDPDRTRLADWLSPALYTRFETQKTRFDPGDGRIEELRPPFAALRLYQHALDAVGLTRSNEIEHAVLEMAGASASRSSARSCASRIRWAPSSRRARFPRRPRSTAWRAPSSGWRPICRSCSSGRSPGRSAIVQRLRALPFADQLEACIRRSYRPPGGRASWSTRQLATGCRRPMRCSRSTASALQCSRSTSCSPPTARWRTFGPRAIASKARVRRRGSAPAAPTAAS